MSTTLVVQSYRTRNVPEWLTRCLQSVVRWTRASGYQYEFLDDSFLDLVPRWYRERCGAQLLPTTDLARLVLMRDRLRQGYQRVIWFDADVCVFAPERLRIDARDGFALCYEMWIEPDGQGGHIVRGPAINNAVMVMDVDNPMLDFYIYACHSVVRMRAAGSVGRLDTATELLSRFGSILALPLIDTVGLFSPPITKQVAQGGGPLCALYATTFGRAIGAANLCGSLRGSPIGGVIADDADYLRAVDVLERTSGDVVNRHLSPPSAQRAG